MRRWKKNAVAGTNIRRQENKGDGRPQSYALQMAFARSMPLFAGLFDRGSTLPQSENAVRELGVQNRAVILASEYNTGS